MKFRKSYSNIALVFTLSCLIFNISLLAIKEIALNQSPQEHVGELSRAISYHGIADTLQITEDGNPKEIVRLISELVVKKFNGAFSKDYMMVAEIKQDELLLSTYSLNLLENFCVDNSWVTEVNTGFNLKNLSEKTKIVAYNDEKEAGVYEYPEGFKRLLGFKHSVLCKNDELQVETIRITDRYDLSKKTEEDNEQSK